MGYNSKTILTCVARNVTKGLLDNGWQPKDIPRISDWELTQQQINNIIAGKSFLSARSLAALCNVFRCTPQELFRDCKKEDDMEDKAETTAQLQLF